MELDQIEDLFEEHSDRSDNDEGKQEAIGERSSATLELDSRDQSRTANGTETAKKRVVRNPQPKLDPDRIFGPKGVPVLATVFQDFQPKGRGHEFQDLDRLMKRMEHWAHRLYPKLPFLDVMERVSELGKKKAVQVNLKKLRLGMFTPVEHPDAVPEQADDNDEEHITSVQEDQDTTKRYENDDDADFEELLRSQEPDLDEIQSQILS